MVNGKKEIKKRIMAIAAYKKQMIWSAVLVVVFALLLSACTAGTVEPESGDGEVLQDSEIGKADGRGTDSTDEQASASGAEPMLKLGVGVVQNADGSFRLSEYEVDLTGDKVKERKSLTKLPENAEELILSGEILCMDVSKENHTAGRLDIDGDGEKEVLYLDAVGNTYNEDGWRDGIIDTNYRIRVNDQYYQNYCDIMDPVLMAYSPDGENILLAVYDDGPSGDPLTSFFRYDESGLHQAGSIPGDLRNETIDDERVIHCSFRGDMIQTQWAWGHYYWNGSEIVRREDEVYYYLDDSEWRKREELPLVLLQEITVYEERSENSTAIIMSPQEIQCVASDMKQWVLLEAEDGTKGWIRVVRFKIPSLDDKGVSEVFEGLNMVD